MTDRILICAVLFCLVIPSCYACQVTIRAEQDEYYFLTGEEAALPLTLANSCSHDITGMLRTVMVPEHAGLNGTPAETTVQEKTFTFFSGQRSYLLPAGRSVTPLVFHSTISFSYPENGGRRAELEDIAVHFVLTPAEIRVNRSPKESTDFPDPAAGAGGISAPGSAKPPADPLGKVLDNQVRQDVQGLQQLLQDEDAESLRRKQEFLALLMSDEIIAGIDRSLIGNGFTLAGTGVSPVTNISGNFSLTYEKAHGRARVSGSIDEGRLLVADESSGGSIPLPDALRENETFRIFERERETGGFVRNETRIHYTSGGMTVNLTYGDAKNQYAYLRAAIVNGTITDIRQDGPGEPSPYLVPVLPVAVVCLLSIGILYLGRRLPRQPVPEAEYPGFACDGRPAFLTIAETLLDEACLMAERGEYPGAYARAGRSLRVIVSHTRGDGGEMTNEDIALLPGSRDPGDDRMIRLLDRCSRVAFAQATPDPNEFEEIRKFVQNLLRCN